VADKLPATLGREGLGQVVVEPIAPAPAPRQLVLEATYADPNGELQTLRDTRTLWPAAVVAGIKAEGWAAARQDAPVQALALDLQGKPKAGVPLDVRAIARTTLTSRKRMVGASTPTTTTPRPRTWAPCAPAPATPTACWPAT
jgi:hypothetical protein